MGIPVLIVWGREDTSLLLIAGGIRYWKLPGYRSEVLEGAGHLALRAF
jgi:pimeloyl-ACP methyl ester carboxylesterase